MAAILDSVLVPRSFTLPSSAVVSPVAASSALVGLPHYRGLKVGSTLRTRPIGSRSYGLTYGVVPRRGGVVVCCEAQETAVEEKDRWPERRWPELLGTEGTFAKETIERENPSLNAIILLEGTPVTKDLRFDRVRVWVDTDGIVTEVPTIG